MNEICTELIRVQADGAALDELLQLAARRIFEIVPGVRGVGIYELDADRTLTLGPWVGDDDRVPSRRRPIDAAPESDQIRVAIAIGDRLFGEIGIRAEGQSVAPELLEQARRIAACLAQNYELRRSLCG